MSTTTGKDECCPFCLQGGAKIYHIGGPCDKVEEIEYFPDGNIKRVKLRGPQPMPKVWPQDGIFRDMEPSSTGIANTHSTITGSALPVPECSVRIC